MTLAEENRLLRGALADALDFITGDISGQSQRQGILREGFALLASGIEAPSGVETVQQGSTEGESQTPKGDAQ